MKPIVVTEVLALSGVKVERGPSWQWGNQDGGIGSVGTIRGSGNRPGWVQVEWKDGMIYNYRIGANGAHDLIMHLPHVMIEQAKQANIASDPTPPTVDEMRDALAKSIISPKHTYNSQTQKSNTNYGNTKPGSRVCITNTGALKVCRPSRKIKGSEGRSS